MLRDFRKNFEDLGVEERIDTYLIPRDKPFLLPKFRGGEAFEVKRRLNEPGNYELWEVAAREDFPLSRNTVAWLLDMLGEQQLQASPLPDSRAAVELFAPQFGVFCMPKMRRLFQRDGCKAEITHVLISLKPYETVAFDSEDAAAIADNVEKFQLGGFDNKNYGAMLSDVAVQS